MDKKFNITSFLEFVYSFYKTMEDHEITLVYEGEVTHQITKAFTSLTETNMQKDEESNSTQKKVFHVMVECLQNISKHADNLEGENINREGRGIFMVSKGESEYSVTTGNILENPKATLIAETLDKINKLDHDGLKKLYKQQIKEGRLSNKGGAGLGFIDIAKKTGQAINYNFLNIDDNFSFFVLTSKILRI